MTKDNCTHTAAPRALNSSEILSGGVIIDASDLPPAGSSRYTSCVHCGSPLIGARDTRPRMTIWSWRELMGFDPYGTDMPVPDEATS